MNDIENHPCQWLGCTKPKPAAAPALPTLAELDAWIADFTCGRIETSDRAKQRFALLLSLRPLVEEAECKAAIEAMGFRWVQCYSSIMVSGNGIKRFFTDWPAARDWAVEQAKQAARERVAAAGA
jgi:hypothetical protein